MQLTDCIVSAAVLQSQPRSSAISTQHQNDVLQTGLKYDELLSNIMVLTVFRAHTRVPSDPGEDAQQTEEDTKLEGMS